MTAPKDGYFDRRNRFLDWLVTHPEISSKGSMTARIGVLLAMRCNPKRPYCYLSYKQIAHAMGCDVSTVERHIAKLKTVGAFKVRSGGTDFLTGEGMANHYSPVFSAANNFSLNKALGVPLSNEVGVTLSNEGVIGEDEGRSLALPPFPAGRSVAAAPMENSNGTMWKDFQAIYALAVEHNKAGDSPIEKTFELYVEARGYPNVTAESLYEEYRKELDFWKGKRRNKADVLAKFLQNPLKITGSLNAKPSAANTKDQDRATESSEPVVDRAETTGEPVKVELSEAEAAAARAAIRDSPTAQKVWDLLGLPDPATMAERIKFDLANPFSDDEKPAFLTAEQIPEVLRRAASLAVDSLMDGDDYDNVEEGFGVLGMEESRLEKLSWEEMESELKEYEEAEEEDD